MITIAKILCAIDLSPQTKPVANYAIAMAKAFNAEITVVYVAPQFNQYLSFDIMPESIGKFTVDVCASATKALKKEFDEAFAGVNAKMEVLQGYPATEIVDYAKTNKVDLIVMGTHGHQGLNRILFGSVAEGVVKNSPIPVLTIRPQE